jgi:hypothetical protein
MFVAVAALFTSCADWLDVAPKDKTREEDLFATQEGIYSANSGLYREIIGANLYGRNLTQTTVDAMGHVLAYSGSATEPLVQDGNVRANWALARFDYTRSTVKGSFASIWSSGYTMLLHINTYIKNLSESQAVMSAREKSVLLGEAYGLRAYLHFDLFRLFGPVWKYKTGENIMPYHNKTKVTMNHTGYEETEYSTADEYIALLLGDIAKAVELLKDNDPIVTLDGSITNDLRNDNFFQNRNRRMNYYAVRGLEARVKQYCGQHAEAAVAAREITDLIEAGKRFKWPNPATFQAYNNYLFFGEVIFGINNLDMSSQAVTLYDATELRKAYVVHSKNLFDNILGYDGTLENMVDIRSRQWTSAEITDVQGVDYAQDGAYKSKKYRKYAYRPWDGSTDYYPAVADMQVLMRVSEMYYIQAEAALAGGDTDKAAELLNQVLKNRGLTQQYLMSGTNTVEEFNALLEKEYYREFIGEGQVFFFHKRRASTKMFKGYDAGTVDVENPAVNYVVPIPEEETNI